MMHMLNRHRKSITQIFELCIVNAILAIALSSVDIVWSLYVKSFVGVDTFVGLLTALFSVLSLISYVYFIPLMERYDKVSLYSLTLLSCIGAYLLFSFTSSFVPFLVGSLALVFATVICNESFGVLIRNESNVHEIGKNEGIAYSISNVGWLIGPFAGGLLADLYGIKSIFLLAAVFSAIAFLTFHWANVRDRIKHPTHFHTDVLKNLRAYFKDKRLAFAYAMNVGLGIWWSLVFVFIPLFIIENGLGTTWIGITVLGAGIPMILLEYFTGAAIRDVGFKKFFMGGYLILAVTNLLLSTFSNIFLILLFVIYANLGAAFLEPTSEAYFFRVIKKKDEDRFYGPYRTSKEVGSLLGKVLGAVMLFFLPHSALFLAVGAIMLVLFGLSSRMEDIKA